jgi:hypothetical protein
MVQFINDYCSFNNCSYDLYERSGYKKSQYTAEFFADSFANYMGLGWLRSSKKNSSPLYNLYDDIFERCVAD